MTATTEPEVLFRPNAKHHPDGHDHHAPPGISIYHSHPYDSEHWHSRTDHSTQPGRDPRPWPDRPEPLAEPRYAQRLFGGMVRERMRKGGHPFP